MPVEILNMKNKRILILKATTLMRTLTKSKKESSSSSKN